MGGGTGGGGQPGQIQGSDTQNALFGTQMSDLATQNRYQQLGLGGVGASPAGATSGAVKGVPGSGTTPVNPGQFTTGTTTIGGAGGGANAPGGFSVPTGGPTAMEMDIGAAPSWTGGIPMQFQGALGEGQFQDLSATTQAAVGAQQAKGQVAQGIGGLIGGI